MASQHDLTVGFVGSVTPQVSSGGQQTPLHISLVGGQMQALLEQSVFGGHVPQTGDVLPQLLVTVPHWAVAGQVTASQTQMLPSQCVSGGHVPQTGDTLPQLLV